MTHIEPGQPSYTRKLRTVSNVQSRASEAESNAAKGKEIARYVAEMVLELRNLARSAKLDRLMVPLESAFYEASAIADAVSIPAAELDRLRELRKAAERLEPPSSP
jgi:hypothetical protein